MTVTLCVFSTSVGFFSFGMTYSFHFENHFLFFFFSTPAESVFWLKVSTPSNKSFWFLNRHVPPKKQKFLSRFPSQSFDLFKLDLTLVGGEKCFVSAVVSLTFQAVSPFCSLNEVEQCTANTSWFTFKKQNNKTGQKLKT